MTVSSTTNRKTFAGNGSTTSFPTTPVVFFDTSDLTVFAVTTATGASTTLVENTDYTVSGGDGDVGTVDTSTGALPYGAPASGMTLVIVRTLPLTQETDFVQNDSSDASVAETALDKVTMMAQQLDARIDRSFTLSDSDVSGASTELPTPAATTLLGWNGAGTALQNYSAETVDQALTTPFTLTLLDDATAAAARTTQDAQQEVNSLTQDTNPDEAADFVLTRDVSAGADKKVLIADMLFGPTTGRLTLTTAVPVTTGDVTAAATVYWTPFKGEILRIYDGTRMVPYASAELSVALDSASGHTGYHQSGKNFDVFAFNDAGTLRIGTGPAWTSDTGRGTGAGTTELAVKNGLYVNKVSITLRWGSASGNTVAVAANQGAYLGSFRASADGQTEDSLAKRFVWNNYNRVQRAMVAATEGTNSWTYSTATWRQANANAANQLDYVVGLLEDPVSATVHGIVSSNNQGPKVAVGVGVDVTNANSAQLVGSSGFPQSVATYVAGLEGSYKGYPGLGRHFLAWLEISEAAGTTTFYGDDGLAYTQAGIIGEMRA